MDNLNLLGELDDRELDSLMSYVIPYTDENKLNIKKKFAQNHDKLKEEKMLSRKKTKLTVVLVAAVLFCLTTLTVFAATQGAFHGLFSNLDDVAEYVQTPNERVTSSGITMELSSYLADNSGIAMELIFTRDDGSIFVSDTVGIGDLDRLSFWASDAIPHEAIVVRGSPEVVINNRMQWISPLNIVSDDSLTYRSFIVANGNFADIDIPLEINVNRLIYNIGAHHETVHIDLYELYQNSEVAEVILYNTEDYMQVLQSLLDNASITPIQTESGIEIHSIVFARAKVSSGTNYDLDQLYDSMDGIDIAGFLSVYEYIVGIKYTSRVETNGIEYHFGPTNLHNNHDPFSMRIVDSETDIGYQFFRVSCIESLMNYGASSFEYLKNIDGIDFTVFNNNFIEGEWQIQTYFSANRESSHVVLEEAIDTGNPNIVPVLLYADISLFTTTISLEVRDSDGNINRDDHWHDMFNFMSSDDVFSLRYKNGEEIQLSFMMSGMCCCGIQVFTSHMPMTQDYFVLMNTSQLAAIVINGVEFTVE